MRRTNLGMSSVGTAPVGNECGINIPQGVGEVTNYRTIYAAWGVRVVTGAVIFELRLPARLFDHLHGGFALTVRTSKQAIRYPVASSVVAAAERVAA
jgi:hypothetical protein